MSTWMIIVAFFAVAFPIGLAFRKIGQSMTNNAPYFRDMSTGVAYGYALGAMLLAFIGYHYITSWFVEGPAANKYFFFRVALRGLFIFAVAAYIFREFGKRVGTERPHTLQRRQRGVRSRNELLVCLFHTAF